MMGISPLTEESGSGQPAAPLSARIQDLKWGPAAMRLRLAIHELSFRSRMILGSWIGPSHLRTVCRGIRKEGFAIVPGYFSQPLLKELRKNCSELTEQYGSQEADGKYWISKKPGALRLRHLNERSPLMDLFSQNIFCRIVNALFCGSLRSPSVQYSLTHDGSSDHKLVPGAAERTFADTYHIDQWHHQLKAVIPLRDVEAENGPLTLLPGSSAIQSELMELYRLKHMYRTKDRSAFKDNPTVPDETRPVLRERFGERKMVAREGDLILFDTRSVHFAGRMERGERQLLWLYF